MIPKNFKSIMQDDCDKLFKKFQNLAEKLNAMDSNLSMEYLKSLPVKERNVIIERAIKLQMEFVPMIQLWNSTSHYLEFMKTTLDKMFANQEKEDNESRLHEGPIANDSQHDEFSVQDSDSHARDNGEA